MALELSNVGATRIGNGLFAAQANVVVSQHFGSGNYDPAARAETIQNGQSVDTALPGAPVLAGIRSDSGGRVQWAFQDSDLTREFDYAEVVFVAAADGIATPAYLDSNPVQGASLGSKSLNTIRQWVLQVVVATGEITVYETRISVPYATDQSPGAVRLSTPEEADAGIEAGAVPPVSLVRRMIARFAPAIGGPAIVAALVALGGNARLPISATRDAIQSSRIAADIARLAAPLFSGNARSDTPPTTDNSTRIATTEMVQARVADFSRVFPVTVFDAAFPAAPANGQYVLFRAAVAAGLNWRDTNGTTILNSAAVGDLARYNGALWIKQVTQDGDLYTVAE